MTVTVQVRELPVTTCRTCQHPIRLFASLQTETCCCCRNRCHLEHGYGCQVCAALLPDCDAELGLCAGCRVVA